MHLLATDPSCRPSPDHCFEEVSRQWLDLAERGLSYYAGLYQSGRWQRYYTPQNFAARIVDVMKAVAIWRSLSGCAAGIATGTICPAAELP